MKKVCLSSPVTKLFCLTSLLACFSLSGCDLLEEEESCKDTTTESKVWTPSQGFVDYLYKPDVAYWYPSLGTAGKKYTFENVCPQAVLQLDVNVKEKSGLEENHAFEYEVEITYPYTERFSQFDRIVIFRTDPFTMQRKFNVLADPLGILFSATSVTVNILVEVPPTGNETLPRAIEWANNYIESITISASFTKFK